MLELLKAFENKRPELVFEWKDSETGAEGWVVINSLRGGAAGGGTRMRKGLDRREVESLAKTMEIKFSVSGPAIGGAKSGINFDPEDPRKTDVLRRWYRAVLPLLKNYYGTGGDLNVDEIHEVIPITEDLGLWHPQEGVVAGHFTPRQNEKIQKVGNLRVGVSKLVEDPRFTPNPLRKFVVADLITGYGVAEGVFHFYRIWNKDMAGKRAIIQGWGNVASAAAYYLAQNGVRIVGILDRNGGLIHPDGFSFSEIRQLFLDKKGNALISTELKPFDQINQEIWDIGAEIFIPAASSRLVNQDQCQRLIGAGLEVVSCGANVPFADSEIFMGPITSSVDQQVALIPDFIANCGMARVFAYLMSAKPSVQDEAIFKDVSDTIAKALQEIHDRKPNATVGLTETAFEIALKKLL
jgi:glutamate dehydrogenase/leucine dehydrogenase